MMADETCANCGDKIGKLQTAYIFNDKIVCHKCNLILQAESSVSEIKSNSPPPLHVAHSSDLREINKSTQFLKNVVIAIIILLVVIGIVRGITAALNAARQAAVNASHQ